MPQPFKDHPSDTQVLNQNTLPISQCNKRVVLRDDEWIEVTDVPVLTGECLWHIYQDEAEEIVAPGGVLIADPVERNRVINAAYARLWLADPRFQWAGLAAFASKQVGCGMMHATRLIDVIEEEHVATLFLDIYPLHASEGFELIDAGDIAESVKLLARHEQQNILQLAMYSDAWLVTLLRGNHVSYVLDFPSGVSQALELTLASQCNPLDDGRTVGFSKNVFADLSVFDERIEFVQDAAEIFDLMLKDHRRSQLEQSIREIAAGTSA